jgi:Mrp family chromosome partitioning ATPase
MLAKHLNLPSTPGVTNYLSGAVDSIDQITQHHSHCDIIVAGPIPPNPSELLLGDRIETLINALKERYDYVILDSAPIGLVSDTFSLTKFTEVTLYVSRANYTKLNFIKYLNEVAALGQLNNVAIIVNDTDAKLSHGYGYGYGASQKD